MGYKINTKYKSKMNTYSRYGTRIKYIVIHYTGDCDASARDEARYLYNGCGGRDASWHYTVDSKSIYKSAPLPRLAGHCGGDLESSHHPLHGICKNANSIGIEICFKKIKGKNCFERGTVERVYWLVHRLCRKYGIPRSHIVRHYDVTGKACPNAHYITEKGTVSIHSLLNTGAWHAFRNHAYQGK